MTSTTIGTKKVIAVQKDGSKQTIMLKNCRFVPELWVNLFSVNKALSNGFQISNEGLTIKLKKKNTKIKFDRIYSIGTGSVIGITQKVQKSLERANNISVAKKVSSSNIHTSMVHAGETTTRWTAAYYGIRMKEEMDPCKHC